MTVTQIRLLASTTFFMGLIGTITGTSLANAADIPSETRISAVTVYGDRASVTRTGTVTVTPGDHVVVIDGLPGGLSPDSLRADGSSTAGVTLGAVDHKIINAAQLSAPRERELRAKLLELQDQRALIVADQSALNARMNFLNKIGDTASTRVNEDIKTNITLKPEEWGAAAVKISSTISDTQKSLHGIVIALRKLDDEINAVQHDLNGIANGGKQTVSVRIPLTANADGMLTFNVEYQVYGASWRPLYDARLATATNTLDLSQFGEVRQVTGEDWTNAKLTLSTAQPARGATPPDLFTQWVNVYETQPSTMMMASSFDSAGGASISSKSMRAPANVLEYNADRSVDKPAPVAFQGAQIETGGYVASFHIPGTTTVTADNTAKKVMIQKLKTTTSLVAQARPALDPSVYLMAKVKLGGDTPLLPGPVNLFRDNAFIGNAMQQMLRPGEDTDLPFGIDDQVVMKRQAVEKRGTSGVISTQSTLDRLYDTEIQNLHRFKISLEILESVPVAQDERVKVTLDTKNTTPGFEDNVQKITGLKKWRFDTLDPKAKQNVKLGYTVSWPKDLNVNGL